MKPLKLHTYLPITIYLFSLSVTTPVYADTLDDITLDEVTVTAIPGQQHTHELIRPVSVLDGDQLDRAKGSNIGDTVASIPGVHSTGLGQATGRPVIRGLDGPRVDVTENGMSSADVATLSQDHAVTVEPFLAEQIEVLKGPSTLLYGSGAIGGVVNIADGRIPETVPENGVEGRYESRFDSVSRGQTHMLSLNAGGQHLAVHIDGLHRRDKDYRTPARFGGDEGQDRLHGKLPNSYLQTDTGSIGASWIDDWGFIGASITRYLDEYGAPSEPGDFSDPTNIELPVHIGMQQTRYDLKGALKRPTEGIKEVRASFTHAQYQHTEYEGNDADTTFHNKSNQARVLITHDPIAGWEGTLGTQLIDRNFSALGDEADFIPKTRTRGVGLFVTENYHWEQVKLELGARQDWQSSDPDNANKRSFQPTSLSSGISWQFAAPWQMTLNLDRSQRAPAEEELFANGEHEGTGFYEVGNPHMAVETGNQIELGLKFNHPRLEAKASIYYNHFKNFIFLRDTGIENYNGGDFNRADWSQSDANLYGMEADTTLHLQQNASGNWDWRTYGDLVHAKLANGKGNIPRIPSARLGSEILWSLNRINASVGVVHYYHQNRVANYESKTAGYTLLNAQVSWDIISTDLADWEVFLKGDNLSNRTARLATSLFKDESPQPGRNISVGVRAWF